MKSTLSLESNPLHVAIIMDGNGRWAARRGMARIAGHRAGGEAIRRVVEAAPRLGIGTLTLYAFSADNWRRPAIEVDALMRLFRRFLQVEPAGLAARRRAPERHRAPPTGCLKTWSARLEPAERMTAPRRRAAFEDRDRLFGARGNPARRPRVARPANRRRRKPLPVCSAETSIC